MELTRLVPFSRAHLNDRQRRQGYHIEAEDSLRLVLIVGINAWQQSHHRLRQDLTGRHLHAKQKVITCVRNITHEDICRSSRLLSAGLGFPQLTPAGLSPAAQGACSFNLIKSCGLSISAFKPCS